MNQNPIKETVSIDLTKDDINIQESLSKIQHNAVNMNNSIQIISQDTTSQKTNLQSSDSLEVSAVDFIEDLQKGNSQIETVFIESDEEENIKKSKSLPPSGFRKNLSNNSSTVALQNDQSSSRKLLVIPKEVASMLTRSRGPLSLNIPGIGPLLIPKPSDILVPQPVQELFQINKLYQGTHEKTLLKNNDQPKYDPLTDSKYCWRYQRKRKRDLEGFTLSDRLGFYKAEQHRGKICATKYKEIIKKYHSSIRMKEMTLMAIRNTRSKIENAKLVEIDSIRKGKKRDLSNTIQNHVKVKMLHSPAKPKEKRQFSSHHCVSSVPLSSSESDSQISNDLLVTKKVVFISDERPRNRKRKKCLRRFTSRQSQMLQKRDEKLRLKAKYDILQGQIKNRSPRQKRTETVQLGTQNLPSASMLSDYTQDTKNTSIKKAKTYKIKNPNTQVSSGGYPERRKSSNLTVTEFEKRLPHNIKPCRVEIIRDNLVEQALKKYNDQTFKCTRDLVDKCNIIHNLKQFQNVLQPIKPILVINEDHCAKMNFQEEFCKYNIVFPMSEITLLNLNITNRLFVASAIKGYIKFVQPRILCKYLAGFREPL